LIDQTKAFEVKEGILVEGAAGLFSGSSSPLGYAAPIGTRYYQTTTGDAWRKFGSGDNDWLITPIGTDRQATASSTKTLATNSNEQQIFYGTVAGQILKLPNATLLSSGKLYEVWNFSDQTIQIVDNGSNELAILKANARTTIVLNDNSTSNGIWGLSYPLDSGNVFGSNVEYIEDNSETSTSSTTVWLNKLSLAIVDMPEGDYLCEFQFIWRAGNANRSLDVRAELNNVTQITWKPFTANVADRQLLRGVFRSVGISGNNTFELDFKVGGSGTTVYMSEAKMFVWRIA
jgi:hypothetical protein